MDDLLRNWDIGRIAVIDPIPSYGGKTSLIKTMDGRCYILKEKPNVSQAEHEAELLSRLYEAGAPVAVPIRTVQAKPSAWHTGKIFCLYPKLPGESIAEHYAGDAIARARRLGYAIGFLHTCFLKCDEIGGYKTLQLIEQIQDWGMPCIRAHNAILEEESVEKIWQEVEQELGAVYARLPEQLIHRDLHPANMLFDAGKLTGFVDFEMVVRGPRVFDLCYCGTSLLVSGFPDTEKMRTWPALFHVLLKGYQEVCQLTPVEFSALRGTLAAIELLFAAFSLENRAEAGARCNLSLLKWLSANRELLANSNLESYPSGFMQARHDAQRVLLHCQQRLEQLEPMEYANVKYD